MSTRRHRIQRALVALVALLHLSPPACVAQAGLLETRFARLPDDEAGEESIERTADVRRAIVLIHGIQVHPFSEARAHRPSEAGWQSDDGFLGRALAGHGDLYAFSYSQNVPVDEVATAPDTSGRTLADRTRALRAAGYDEVVLVGHSAGGLVARRLVEEVPDCGVTRVVQVATPNAGSGWASVEAGVRAGQEPFLESLTREARDESTGRSIPEGIEFVCVVAAGAVAGDFVVTTDSQWPTDLREQGIGAVALVTTHFTVMRSIWTADAIAELVSTPQPRWDADRIAAAEADILGD